MGSERETALPIESFGGVNLNSDKEDLTPNQLLGAQNLWEPTLGVLETRYGSETVTYKPTGVVANGLRNIHKIYKSSGDKSRFCAVQCEPDIQILTTLPTGVSLSFVTSSGSAFNLDRTFGAGTESGTTFGFTPRRIMLRFVGYGVDYWYEILTTAVTGYAAATAQKLVLSVTSGFVRTKITGIEVYVSVACGSNGTPVPPTSITTYQEQTMWVGFMDTTSAGALSKDFKYAPAQYHSTIAANTTIGSSERSFNVFSYQSGVNGITGSFIGGKTYFVAILPQYTVFSTGAANRCAYRQPSVDVYGSEIVAITIPGNTTGYIKLKGITPNTVAFLVAVGETRQTLQPTQLFNNSALGEAYDSPPPIAESGAFMITEPPKNNPGVIDMTYTQTGLATLSFRVSDYSRSDMFLGINDDNTTYPIFAGRMHKFINDSNYYQDVISVLTTVLSPIVDYPYVSFSILRYGFMHKMGEGARYVYQPWDDYAFFVNDYDPTLLTAQTSGFAFIEVPAHKTYSNYWVIDGKVAALVVCDVNSQSFTGLSTAGATNVVPTTLANVSMIGATATVTAGTNFTTGTYKVVGATNGVSLTFSSNVTTGAGSGGVLSLLYSVTLPHAKYITKFDSSIILGGGNTNIDPVSAQKNSTAKSFVFSRALNPFDFTIAGATYPTLQTINQDDDGENITGFGIYTNTTTDSGPLSQLVTAKKNCLWIINNLPQVTGGQLGSTVNRILSKKVGGYHATFVNTPIGTLVAGFDNVYLLREDGEPTPVGQGISPLLKDANMARAFACYHDRHYKLSFSHPDYPDYNGGNSNNVEMWLNINKMVEQKGGEDWVGPMLGRAVDYCFVEDRDGDGGIYNQARTRYAIDNYSGNGRIFKADVTPSATADIIYDTKTPTDASDKFVTAVLTSKDFDISQGDNNWQKLLKKFYVKCRTNWTATTGFDATYALWVDGETYPTAGTFGTSVTASPGAFKSKALKLIGLFPPGRINGRTFRLAFAFAKRVAIGGFQINYQINRRRL